MELNEVLLNLQKEIAELKKIILANDMSEKVSKEWLPRHKVMEFLNYGNTQMASFEKTEGLIISKIGKRKFIRRDSVEKLLNNNTISNVGEI